jgi:hypothetical protein
MKIIFALSVWAIIVLFILLFFKGTTMYDKDEE